MRLLKILVVILILTPVVSAQQYGLSGRLDSLRVYIQDRANLSINSRADPPAELNRLINKNIQELCTEIDAIWKIDTLSVTKDSTGAALADDFLRLKNVLFMTEDSLWIPLKIVSSGDSLAVMFSTDHQANPSKSDTDVKTCRVHANRLLFHPKWSSKTTGQYFVEYWAMDSLLNADASVTQVRAPFRQLIIDKVVAEILGQ